MIVMSGAGWVDANELMQTAEEKIKLWRIQSAQNEMELKLFEWNSDPLLKRLPTWQVKSIGRQMNARMR